jgi:putative ABC transport system ATP-binding protein
MERKPSNGAQIELHGLVKAYHSGGEPVVALKSIDLQVAQGEFLIVSGKSGSGKSTLVNMIAGLDRPTAGEIEVGGVPVHRLGAATAAAWRGRTVGIVFQSFELLPSLTVLQNVTLPMDFAGKFTRRARRRRALDLLAQVDIAEHAHKLPSAVSGGQRQRVAIARAMANDPPLLLADEPTGSLDWETATQVMDIFGDLVAQGRTVVLVTHDPDVAAWGTRTLTLHDGEIVC